MAGPWSQVFPTWQREGRGGKSKTELIANVQKVGHLVDFNVPSTAQGRLRKNQPHKKIKAHTKKGRESMIGPFVLWCPMKGRSCLTFYAFSALKGDVCGKVVWAHRRSLIWAVFHQVCGFYTTTTGANASMSTLRWVQRRPSLSLSGVDQKKQLKHSVYD